MTTLVMMKFYIFFILLSATLRAWNLQTHMTIARIAYDILEKDSPDALRIAEAYLGLYSDNITRDGERDHPFVECVTYADMIKYRGGSW